MSEGPESSKHDFDELLEEITKKCLENATGKSASNSPEAEKPAESTEKKDEDDNKKLEADRAKKQDEQHQEVLDMFAPNASKLVKGLESLAYVALPFQPIKNMNRLELTLLFDKALEVSKKILYQIYGEQIGNEIIQSSRTTSDHSTDMMLTSSSELMSSLIADYNPVENTEVNSLLSSSYREGFEALEQAIKQRKTKTLGRHIEQLHHAVNLLLKARCATLVKLRR